MVHVYYLQYSYAGSIAILPKVLLQYCIVNILFEDQSMDVYTRVACHTSSMLLNSISIHGYTRVYTCTYTCTVFAILELRYNSAKWHGVVLHVYVHVYVLEYR